MKKTKNQKKEKKFEYVDIKLDEDIYFRLLQICIDTKKTIDEIILMAIENYKNELIKGEK
jgi:hypothetical protein